MELTRLHAFLHHNWRLALDTAIQAQATGLITNDAAFQHVDAFETLLLDHLL